MNDSSERTFGPSSLGRALAFGLPLLWFAIALWAHRATLDFTILGHDSYPLLESAVCNSLGDLPGVLTKPFLEGNFLAKLHRPGQNLFLAAEWAAFGFEPRGYQVVQWLNWSFMILAVHALVLRLVGHAAGHWASVPAALAAGVTTATLALHPIAWEAIPVLSRAHDPLVLSLGCWTLFLLAQPDDIPRRTAIFAGLIAGFAAASKETGYLIGPLAFGLRFLLTPTTGLVKRFLTALVETAPIAIGSVLLLVLRWIVLDGSLTSGTGGWNFELLPRLAHRLWLPQVGLRDSLVPQLLAAVFGLCLVIGALGAQGRGPGTRTRWAIVVLGSVWAAGGLFLPTAMGRVMTWRLLFPEVGLMLPTALMLLGVWQARGALRWISIVGLVSLLALTGVRAGYSPLLAPYGQWVEGDADLRDFLARLDAGMQASQPGDVLRIEGPPQLAFHSDPMAPHIHQAAICAGQSARAYLELKYPDVPFRVTGPLGALGEPREVIQVVLDDAPYDFLGPAREVAEATSRLRKRVDPRVMQAYDEARVRGWPVKALQALFYAVEVSGTAGIRDGEAIRDYLEYIEDRNGVRRMEALLDRIRAGEEPVGTLPVGDGSDQ